MIQKLNITIELEDFETPAFQHWLKKARDRYYNEKR